MATEYYKLTMDSLNVESATKVSLSKARKNGVCYHDNSRQWIA